MDVVMPQLGESVTEGTITRWFKAVGDSVAVDEVLFEVSTDKVDSEVPSPVAGVLLEIVVAEGDVVEVGGRIAVVGEAGSAPAPVAAPTSAEATKPAPEPEPAPEPVAVAHAVAPEASPAPSDPQPSPTSSASQPSPALSAPQPSAEDSPAGGSRVLSPLVRNLMRTHGLTEADVVGTGLAGRITRADVEGVIASRAGGTPSAAAPAVTAPVGSVAPAFASPPVAPARPASMPAAPAPMPAAPAPMPTAPAPMPTAPAPMPTAPAPMPTAPAPTPAVAPASAPTSSAAPMPGGQPGGDVEVVPFSNIRRRTAEHMVRSKTIAAHAACVVEVDYSNVDRVRLARKDAFKAAEGISLTYLPFVAIACVDALREYRHVNASVGDDELLIHRDVHLGIAVDLNFEGLIAPVVHHADQLRLHAMAQAIGDIAKRARARELGIDDISGGTFTITNNGTFGSVLTLPIINQPQVAILSTDAVRKAATVVELPTGEDAVVVRPMGRLVMSWDHRAFDGAYAGAFVSRVKEILETRDWSAEF